MSLVPHKKLLTYLFAFDLVEGGTQDFLENVRTELPDGDEVCVHLIMKNHLASVQYPCRKRRMSMTNCGIF